MSQGLTDEQIYRLCLHQNKDACELFEKSAKFTKKYRSLCHSILDIMVKEVRSKFPPILLAAIIELF